MLSFQGSGVVSGGGGSSASSILAAQVLEITSSESASDAATDILEIEVFD